MAPWSPGERDGTEDANELVVYAMAMSTGVQCRPDRSRCAISYGSRGQQVFGPTDLAQVPQRADDAL